MRPNLLSTTALLAAFAMGYSAPSLAQSPGTKGNPPSAQQPAPPQQGNQPQGRDDATPQGRQLQDQSPRGDSKNSVQSREKGAQGQQSQSPKPEPRKGKQDQTTGHGESVRSPGHQGHSNQQNPVRRGQGQTQQPSSANERNGTAGQAQPQQGRHGERQGQPQQAKRDNSPVNLSAEQRTRIRTTVMANANAPRVDNVNFSIRVGSVVPRRVRVVDVPTVLIDIYPQWRGHRYFLARDEIVIVDRDYRIISVVAVGSGSGAHLDGRSDAAGVISLSSDEIRQVQIVLRQRGFDIEPDGVLGPRTRQAIVEFQRQQGLQATGEIDQRTSVALGIGNLGPDQTTGQGSKHSPATQAPQNPARSNSPGSSPDMTPEPRNGTRNQPSAR